MNVSIRPIILRGCKSLQTHSVRKLYFKFKRTKIPPLQEPRESPYVVGPYLKPDYVPVGYVTEPLKHRFIDDFDHCIYDYERVESNPDRKVKLLLIDDVEGLGVAGQIVDAPAQFGASKLVAMQKAEYYTEFSKNWYKFGPKTNESASSALSPRTARLLRSQVYQLPITDKTIVQPWHISLALRLAGCVCPLDAIEKDSIRQYAEENEIPLVKCTILINNHERVEVKLSYAGEREST